MNENFNAKTICVEIPAFRDDYLLSTVESALVQADHPERIHFAICYQHFDYDDYDFLAKKENVSIYKLPIEQARGACYARYWCQTLLKDEDYVLHTDAHMRFCKHWDTELIKELEGLKDEKAVLSCYPREISSDGMNFPLDHSFFDKPAEGLAMFCQHFSDDNRNVRFGSRDFTEYDEIPKRNVWTAGGFLFAHRNFDIEVPFDPNMYHNQDELSVSLRAFTHGFNIYNPQKHYLYHLYGERRQRIAPSINAEEIKRLEKLYRISDNEHDLTGYDIGNVRTIEEFENRSGLYYKDRKILTHAYVGIYFEEQYREVLQIL